MTDTAETQLQDNLMAMAHGATLKEVLRTSDDPQLETTLRLAQALQSLRAAPLPEQRVARLQTQLLNAMPTAAPRRTTHVAWWQRTNRAAAVIVAVLCISLLGTTGTVAASAGSMPNEPLYPIKRLWEQIVAFIASLVRQSDDVWLHLATVRYEELVAVLADNAPADVPLSAFNAALLEAQLYASTDTQPLLQQLMRHARETLPTVVSLNNSDAFLQTMILLNTIPTPPAPVLATGAPTITPTITATATISATPMPTNTPFITATATATQSPEPSPTSRFAATATRTPLPQSEILPVTNTVIAATDFPTATWTALPISGLSRTPGVVILSASPTPLLPGATATPNPADDVTSPFIRETEMAVYLTQTAEAP